MKKDTAHRLYHALLRCHPRAFRHEFGDELAWVAAECTRDYGFARLVFDCILSAGTQWWRVLRAAQRRPRGAFDHQPATAWSIVVATALSTALFASFGIVCKPMVSLAERARLAASVERRVYRSAKELLNSASMRAESVLCGIFHRIA